MDDPSFVKVDESLKSLSNERPDESLLERSVVSEESRDGSSWNVLQENVEVGGVDGGVCEEKRVRDVSVVREEKEERRDERPTEVLHDVLMLKLLEKFDLSLESTEHRLLPLLVRRYSSRNLNLLDGHEETILSVHSEED